MTLVYKNLGGYFKWFVVNTKLTIVDPDYIDEYLISLPQVTKDKPLSCTV